MEFIYKKWNGFEARKKVDPEIIEQNMEMLINYVGDSSLKFESNRGGGFFYTPEDNVIHYDLSWFESKEFSSEQILWAIYHELSHFRDARENPNEFLKNFDEMIEKAKEVSVWLKDKYKETGINQEYLDFMTKKEWIDPDNHEKGRMSRFDSLVYEYIHSFYNILDDIYVNKLIEKKAQKYYSGDGKKEVERLYRKLFPSNDYKELPRHKSLELILRDEMTGDGFRLHPEVEEKMKEVVFVGKNLFDILTELETVSDPGKRYKIIRSLVEPIYLDWLKKDIKELDLDDLKSAIEEQWQQNKKEKKQEGEGEEESNQGQGSQEGEQQEGQEWECSGTQEDQMESNSIKPESFDPFNKGNDKNMPGHQWEESSSDPKEIIQEISKQLDELEGFKKILEEDNLDPQGIAKRFREKEEQEFDIKFGINPELRKNFGKIEKKIKPYLEELNRFWKSLIGKSVKYKKEWENKTKGRLNVDRYIKKYSDYDDALRQGKKINSFDKAYYKREVIEKPERIRLTIVGDVSGSMSWDGRIKILREAMTMLLLSIQNFNQYLDRSRKETGSKLEADSEAYIYNDNSEMVKGFRDESRKNIRAEKAEIIKVLEKLNAGGENNEYSILRKINKSIDKEEKKRIVDGKDIRIVFFITDGGMDNIENINEQLRELSNKGVVVVGFQIGSETESEKDIFNKTFSNPENGTYGVFVGKNIANLPKKLEEQIKEIFKDIKI